MKSRVPLMGLTVTLPVPQDGRKVRGVMGLRGGDMVPVCEPGALMGAMNGRAPAAAASLSL